MTSWEGYGEAKLFVTNVLNGTVSASPTIVSKGTVVRIDLDVSSARMPKVDSMTVIGSGFDERTDPSSTTPRTPSTCFTEAVSSKAR
jgi:hypothetical protein